MMEVAGPEGWFPYLAVASSGKSAVSDFPALCTLASPVAFASKDRLSRSQFVPGDTQNVSVYKDPLLRSPDCK
jgi:hypothetical protein